MASIERQIANMQRELLALSSDQAPAPSQITTFTHTVTLAGGDDPEIHTVTFADGIKAFQAYLSDESSALEISVSSSGITATTWADAGTKLTFVSLSEFTIA